MTGPWMANFLEDFRGFMAKYWIVQPATDTEYWETMLADFNEIVNKSECGMTFRNLDVANYCPNCGCAMKGEDE